MTDDIEKFVATTKVEVSNCLNYAERAQERGGKLNWDTFYPNKAQECKKEALNKLKRMEYRVEDERSKEVRELREKFQRSKNLQDLINSAENLGEYLQDLKIEYEEVGYSGRDEIQGLLGSLGPKFSEEKEELKITYGRCNLSTAFLLRRILEKSLDLAFKQNGFKSKIYHNGDRKGLKNMLSKAVKSEDEEGNSFIDSSTERRIKKHPKFVGDSAAHNFHSSPNEREIRESISAIQRVIEELPLKEI